MNLGNLLVTSEAALLASRGKFRLLAQTLGARESEASTLAVVLSEVARSLLDEQGQAELQIDAEPMPLGTRLTLRLPGATAHHATTLEQAFGLVTPEPRLVQAEHVFPLALAEQAPDFVDGLRRRLTERTRTELLSELKLQNERLEKHRAQLEQTVAERTRELVHSTRQAEQANQAKSEFLSHMSHELRTPLNGVLGYAQILLRDSGASDKQRKSLNAIESCGRHLLTLINDVLDLSKIEAGRMDLDPHPMDLHALLHGVSDIVRPRAAAKGVALTLEQGPNVPRAIVADETKLRQVLVNLLGNSVKFTQKGEIHLRASLSALAELVLEVSDTGIGMTAAEQSQLFQPFRQAEGGKVSGGTGLGLAITKKVVDLMAGRVTVESTKGEGTKFRVELPIELADLNGSEQAASSARLVPSRFRAPAGASVLIVDDVEANRDILDSLLAEVGFECVHAADGQDCLDQMRARHFDLVLMDIRMPKLSGDEAIKVIRNDPRLTASKVIAITASVQTGVLDDMLGLGFDDVVGKPFEVNRLLAKVARQLGLETTPEELAEKVLPAATPSEPLSPDQAESLAQAIHEALELGDIGQLGELGGELVAEGGPASRVGDELKSLSEAFDFDGLKRLAAQLTVSNSDG